MRVVMNGIAALKPKTGVGHYVARLHHELQDSVRLYPEAASATLARLAHRQLSRAASGKSAPASFALRMRSLAKTTFKHAAKIAVGVHFAHTCRADAFDLYHEPNFIPFSTDLPTVVTVHDLSVLLHPEWHPLDRVQHHERHFARAVQRAQHLITVSEEMRTELIEHVGVAANKVTAVSNGVGSEFQPSDAATVTACRQRYRLPDRYFLTVGTIEPRKNLLTVLQAFADLPASLRERCPLVHAGPWGWKSEAERRFFDSHARSLGVLHLGYVPADDLPTLYSGAEALLFPSFYEGFGLPPLEMLACGGAVVCASSARAVREVMARHALYLDPLDRSSWREVMKQFACDPRFKDSVRKGGIEHASAFNWRRTAIETMNVYRRTLGLPVESPQVRTRQAA